MKNKFIYLAVAGMLLFVGAGCAKTGTPKADGSAKGEPTEQSAAVDEAVDEMIKDAGAEDTAAEKAATEDAQELDADKTGVNSLKDATYEAE